jgi:hypothetical protein
MENKSDNKPEVCADVFLTAEFLNAKETAR